MSDLCRIRRMRGRAAFPLLSLLVIALAAAGVLTHRWMQRKAAERAASKGPAVASSAPRQEVAVTAMGHAQLLAAARRALAEHRLLAPEGDNAFAYYLEARKRQPHNRVVSSALRELFPFAVESAEQSINAGRFDEAEREIALLDRADPTNYSLNILRAKLDAQRKLAQTPPPAAHGRSKPEGSRVATTTATAPSDAPSQTPPPPAQASAPAVEPKPAAPAPQMAQAAPVAPTEAPVQRTPPLLLRRVQPAYPVAARRAHRQGWVDVGYTVDAEGHVVDAHVVAARPRHIFDVAALNAVRYWEYKPALRDGKAVAQAVQSRILFHL
ncbi:hypothetical protein GCM10027285_14580 [Oleiagrimonas citrea]|uniref:Energy transducer TonB n=1 Tax=Oleiagrimonas citrea TaxID=1665687 RepID=A0A846ZP40_9GAMM|nr:energy transducer TonB [Oleiagrimonas citrea]NKZ40045.1 energy transducer TonB [Oleiagrimonas citrea]